MPATPPAALALLQATRDLTDDLLEHPEHVHHVADALSHLAGALIALTARGRLTDEVLRATAGLDLVADRLADALKATAEAPATAQSAA